MLFQLLFIDNVLVTFRRFQELSTVAAPWWSDFVRVVSSAFHLCCVVSSSFHRHLGAFSGCSSSGALVVGGIESGFGAIVADCAPRLTEWCTVETSVGAATPNKTQRTRRRNETRRRTELRRCDAPSCEILVNTELSLIIQM